MRLKLTCLEIFAVSAIVVHPVLLNSQNTSSLDTSPRTQEEGNRILQHGALPKYSQLATGHSLRERLKRSHGAPVESTLLEGDIAISPEGQRDGLRNWIKDQICRADLVVVARMERQVCGLTSDESLITSDYYFALEERVYSRNISNVREKGYMTIVNSLGGTLDLPEGRASMTIQGLTPFEPGGIYLLFLKDMPGSPGNYELTELPGAFVLTQSSSPRNVYRLVENQLKGHLSALNSRSLISLVASIGRTAPLGCKGAAR